MKDWTSIPGFFDYKQTYDNVVDHLACPAEGGILIECGCYLGKSLCYLGEKIKQSGKNFKVIGIDNGLGIPQVAEPNILCGELIKNVYECGLQDIVSIMVYDSVRAASLFSDNTISFVFLDTKHTYYHLSQEISSWLPKIKINGILGGDDIGIPHEPDDQLVWPQVRQAVNDLLPGWQYSPHDAWIWWKREHLGVV